MRMPFLVIFAFYSTAAFGQIDVSTVDCAKIALIDDFSGGAPLLGAFGLQEDNSTGHLGLDRYNYSPAGEPVLRIGGSQIAGFDRFLDVTGQIIYLSTDSITDATDILSTVDRDCDDAEVLVVIGDGDNYDLINSRPDISSANSLLFKLKRNNTDTYYVYNRKTRQSWEVTDTEIALTPNEMSVEGEFVDRVPWAIWLPLKSDRYFIPSAQACESEFVCQKESSPNWLEALKKKFMSFVIDNSSGLAESAARTFGQFDHNYICDIEKSIAFTNSFGVSPDMKFFAFEASAELEFKIVLDKNEVRVAKQKTFARDKDNFPDFSKSYVIQKYIICNKRLAKNLEWIDVQSFDNSENLNISFDTYGETGKAEYFSKNVYLASRYPKKFVEQKYRVKAGQLSGMESFGPILIDLARWVRAEYDDPVMWYLMTKIISAEVVGADNR